MTNNKTKLQIVEAAGTTFSRFGFKKTTMDDIAFTAGKGKSSIYYYFKNKEEVFEAVTEHEAEILKEEINKALARTEKATDKLRTYIYLRMNRFTAKGNLYAAINDNFLATFSFIEKIRNNHREYELKIISSILNQGIEENEFKPINVDFIGSTLLTAMIGFELPILKNPDANIEFERKINDIMDMFLYGICT
ncbi:TetR/AcrR family transcriptional regulator [Prolixibacteraceae bacterium Z1-6]|uniref:TetR/AcrR family transcriptional regulator n=1 Tax=Draconibacterium aestuarii TaxID=2998507 RepID=A0A9X3J7Q7_9BACT|nr:TetR/AcrR family transcriptional regulator [Prolixibacteraceae bacterium Z1-6]